MELVAIVTALALIEYMYFGVQVGQARVRYKIQAPATTGHEIFERYFRVQQNTVEQLVVFIPALWMFGHFVSDPIGALIGLVFLAGRALYLRSYVADPTARGTGFMLTFVPNALLLLGGLVGALASYF